MQRANSPIWPDPGGSLAAEHKSAKTIRQYADGVRLFLRFCHDTGTEAQLTKTAVRAYVSSVLAAGAQPNTARARYAAVRRFAGWLVTEGELDTDTLAGLEPPTLHTKVVRPLTDAELRDLIKVSQGSGFRDRRAEAIIRLMAETGIRAGECANLKADDVDTLRGTAIVHRGKGGKGRIVPFGPETARAPSTATYGCAEPTNSPPVARCGLANGPARSPTPACTGRWCPARSGPASTASIHTYCGTPRQRAGWPRAAPRADSWRSPDGPSETCWTATPRPPPPSGPPQRRAPYAWVSYNTLTVT